MQDLETLVKQTNFEALDAEESRRSFLKFVKNAWHILEPYTPFLEGYHHAAIADHLEAVVRGDIRRLIVNMPPRFAKSLMCSVMFPMWWWITQPHARFLATSFKEELGVELQAKASRLYKSEWYQRHFASRHQLQLVKDTQSIFENDRTGYRRMAVYESAMGFGFGAPGALLCDDAHNVEDAMSDEKRKKDIRLFDEALSTRANGPNSAIVVIMQRLHESDLTGHLLEKGGYEHLMLPNEFDPRRSTVTSIGWQDPRTVEGELLWEKGMDAKATAERKVALGTFGYAAQYMQAPAPAGGGLIDPSWFRTWTDSTLPKDEQGNAKFDEMLISGDFTFRETRLSDFNVLECWGRSQGQYYLLDLDRFKGDFTVTLRRFVAFCERNPDASTKLVEIAANGEAILSQLRQTIPGMLGVVPKSSKESRVSAIAPWIESGNVHIPESAPWLSDFKHECAMFPAGRHDDMVDSMTQALMRFDKTKASGLRYNQFSVW